MDLITIIACFLLACILLVISIAMFSESEINGGIITIFFSILFFGATYFVCSCSIKTIGEKTEIKRADLKVSFDDEQAYVRFGDKYLGIFKSKKDYDAIKLDNFKLYEIDLISYTNEKIGVKYSLLTY